MTTSTRADLPSSGGLTLAVHRWDPDGAPRGVVHLTHGMGEHLLRYDSLARALTARGFVVLGADQRGHGATAREAGTTPGDLGTGGWDELVADVGRLVDRSRAEFGGLPLVLLGHSMGSFAVQQYLLEHSRDVDAAVLTGTSLVDVIAGQLDPTAPLDLSGFNAPFAPARTDFDWLTRDPDQVDAYVADPWCGFGLDGAGTAGMFAGGHGVADAARLSSMRSDLPVYVAVGEADPVGGPLVLASMLVERYAGGRADRRGVPFLSRVRGTRCSTRPTATRSSPS